MPETSEHPTKRLPTHTQIAERAHQIYLARGGQPGHEKDDWLQAEYELLQLPIHKVAELGVPKPLGQKRKQSKLKKGSLVAPVYTALLLGSTRLG